MKSIIDRLKREHCLFLQDLEELEGRFKEGSDITSFKDAVMIFIEELRKHSSVEETKIYPEFETEMKMGMFKSLADVRESFVEFEKNDAQKVDRLVENFLVVQDMKEARKWFEALSDHYKTHFQIEENVLFPIIEDMVDSNKLEQMGAEISLPKLDSY